MKGFFVIQNDHTELGYSKLMQVCCDSQKSMWGVLFCVLFSAAAVVQGKWDSVTERKAGAAGSYMHIQEKLLVWVPQGALPLFLLMVPIWARLPCVLSSCLLQQHMMTLLPKFGMWSLSALCSSFGPLFSPAVAFPFLPSHVVFYSLVLRLAFPEWRSWYVHKRSTH